MKKLFIIALCILTMQMAFSSQTDKSVAFVVTHITAREDASEMFYMNQTETVGDLINLISKNRYPISVGIRTYKNGHWRYEGLVDTKKTIGEIFSRCPNADLYSLNKIAEATNPPVGVGDNL